MEQLGAEKVVLIITDGRFARLWKLVAGRRNESFDLTTYVMTGIRTIQSLPRRR